ncbi:MAG: hypothetical protein LH473_05315 [Chitinophagales bacterium]|nr:hypothetical protein [Chitinophagales bacterium]
MVGVRHRAIRVTCLDSVAHVRLAKVEVKIVELNLIVKSSKRGIADFSHLDVAEGNYTVTCTLNGYVVFTLKNVAVFNNKMAAIGAVTVKV